MQQVCGYLPTADLLSARLVCRAWAAAAGSRVPVLDLSLKALACTTGLPRVVPMLLSAFPSIHSLVSLGTNLHDCAIQCQCLGKPLAQHVTDLALVS